MRRSLACLPVAALAFSALSPVPRSEAGTLRATLAVSATVVCRCDPAQRVAHRWHDPRDANPGRETRASLALCAGDAPYAIRFGRGHSALCAPETCRRLTDGDNDALVTLVF